MTTQQLSLDSVDNAALLKATRELVGKSNSAEADLLIHLGEIDDRKLYLQCSRPSMFAFCTEDLGFSECAAYNRIIVARIGRKLPAVIDALRSGRVHLAGLRVLAPHLNRDNHELLLGHATGKSKREIEELAARLWPMPPVPTSIRKLPECPIVKTGPLPLSREAWGSVDPPRPQGEFAQPTAEGDAAQGATRFRHDERTVIAPLSAEMFSIQFTASRAFRDKLQAAQDLLSHRIPDGHVPTVLERALDLLIEQVKKERFGVGRKPRGSPEKSEIEERQHTPAPDAPLQEHTPAPDAPLQEHTPAPDAASPSEAAAEASKDAGPAEMAAASEAPPVAHDHDEATAYAEANSRHIPDAIKRAVYERDGGRCTFTDEQGRRCNSTWCLTFEHTKGFARTQMHSFEDIRLVCAAHNQYLAEQMYGREFMEEARAAAKETAPTRPGAS